jgi:hypothetical protein
MFLCNKAHGVILWGERDERKPHDAHSVGFFDFLGAGIYFHACLGCLLALLFTIPFSLVVYDSSHTGKEIHGWSGREIRCLCYLSHGLATTIVVVERARRSLFIVGYTKISRGLGVVLCSFAISYLLSTFSFLSTDLLSLCWSF